MPTYIIGDVQGCYDELQSLLKKIHYHPDEDRLGFVGDLVSRGPKSLETIRFISKLKNPIVVLGNHDLHCLALGYGTITRNPEHSLQSIAEASDQADLLNWLRQQPLMHVDESHNLVIVHAGIPPQWSIDEALTHAREIETLLRGPRYLALLENMYGDEPSQWSNDLTSWDRYRYIINAFTRMRFCNQQGGLDVTNKSKTSSDPQKYKPWFEWTKLKMNIAFGHWAALEGKCTEPTVFALDTACVWGGTLTALRLDDLRRFSVPSQQ